MNDERYERVVCNDGYNVSIQAHYGAYCNPRISNAKLGYSEVELGFPSESDPLINDYAEMSKFVKLTEEDYKETVYPYVPVQLVQDLINKHGGVASGSHPPFKLRKERRWVRLTENTIKVITLSELEDDYEAKCVEMPRRMKRFSNFEDYITSKTHGFNEITEDNFNYLTNLIKTLVSHDDS